jgi:hypothetical protein
MSEQPDPLPDFGDFGHPHKYEFTPEQNELFATLARRMRIVGIVAVMFALVAFAVVPLIYFYLEPGKLRGTPIVVGVFALFLGIWTRRSAREFEKVGHTSGHDILHLMQALDSLNRLYALKSWLLLLSLLVLLAIVVASLIASAIGEAPLLHF